MLKGFLVLGACFMVVISQTLAQVPTSPCTTSMITTFTPCINYLTNSSSSGNSPTQDCCNSLRALMSNGTGCLCQIVTGGVPFRIPINRTLAISLPRACNQPGVPVQCPRTPGAPVPAPGPAAFGPSASPSPAVDMSPSPLGTIPTTETPVMPPDSDTTPSLNPPSTTVGALPPTSSSVTPGTVTPSSAASLRISPLVLLFSVAFIVVKHV